MFGHNIIVRKSSKAPVSMTSVFSKQTHKGDIQGVLFYHSVPFGITYEKFHQDGEDIFNFIRTLSEQDISELKKKYEFMVNKEDGASSDVYVHFLTLIEQLTKTCIY